jgi:hypothetical protein
LPSLDFTSSDVFLGYPLVSIRKLGKGLKKKMYRVQIEIAKSQAERIHLERESYRKAKKCGLFSCTAWAVATTAAHLAENTSGQATGTEAGR